jgi:hypothetical protein
MIRAPNWLPYRLRSAWDLRRVRFALRLLDRTPPVQTAAKGTSRVELHMLICRRDKQIAVLAVKSLFRFLEGPLEVAFTSDGSLSKQDKDWIDFHIRGARWLDRHECLALEGGLNPYPQLLELYQSNYHPLCKLLHPRLLSSAERVIVLDPDTAFFKPPLRLLEWIREDGKPALFLHDHQDEDRQVPGETRQAFQELQRLPAISGRGWQMPFFFFNSGLLAFRRCDICLDVADEYLKWWRRAPNCYTKGKAGLWFGDWTPEQTCYQTIFASMTPPAEPLGDQYRIGGRPNFTFNHFLWLQLVEPDCLKRLSGLINSLGASPCS